MASTGHKWGAWAAVTRTGPADITDYSLAAGTTLTSLSLVTDQKTGVEVSVKVVFGTAHGSLLVAVLGDTDGGTNPETVSAGTPQIPVVAGLNATIYRTFSIDPREYGPDTKLSFRNSTGSAVTLTAKYRTADMPPAA